MLILVHLMMSEPSNRNLHNRYSIVGHRRITMLGPLGIEHKQTRRFPAPANLEKGWTGSFDKNKVVLCSTCHARSLYDERPSCTWAYRPEQDVMYLTSASWWYWRMRVCELWCIISMILLATPESRPISFIEEKKSRTRGRVLDG